MFLDEVRHALKSLGILLKGEHSWLTAEQLVVAELNIVLQVVLDPYQQVRNVLVVLQLEYLMPQLLHSLLQLLPFSLQEPIVLLNGDLLESGQSEVGAFVLSQFEVAGHFLTDRPRLQRARG